MKAILLFMTGIALLFIIGGMVFVIQSIFQSGPTQQFTWRTDYFFNNTKAICKGEVKSFHVDFFQAFGECK